MQKLTDNPHDVQEFVNEFMLRFAEEVRDAGICTTCAFVELTETAFSNALVHLARQQAEDNGQTEVTLTEHDITNRGAAMVMNVIDSFKDDKVSYREIAGKVVN